MIWPLPFNKTFTKLDIIIGVSTGLAISNIDEALIDAHLASGNAVTKTLENVKSYIQGNHYSRWHSIKLLWQSWIKESIMSGHLYVLIPKKFPVYPRYYYWSPLFYSVSDDEEAIAMDSNDWGNQFLINNDFTYKEKKYILYGIKSHGQAPGHLLKQDLIFYVNSLVIPHKEITSFRFTADDNPFLLKDATGLIITSNVNDSTVTFNLDVEEYGISTEDLDDLVHSVEHNGVSISPESSVGLDFSDPQTYTVTDEFGITREYIVTINLLTGKSLNAGGDQTICSDASTITLNAVASGHDTFLWEVEDGKGSFDNNTSLGAVYTLHDDDKLKDQLIFVANTYKTVLGTDSLLLKKAIIVNIDKGPSIIIDPSSVSIGYAINSYQITGVSAENYYMVQWSTSGTGKFSNPNILMPIYQPSTNDKSSGEVILTCTITSNTVCAIKSASETLTIQIS